MPQPLQPFLHDLVGQVAAPTQVWSRHDGQVVPRADGASDVTGLTHADVRLLGGIEVTVDGDAGTPVADLRTDDGGVVFTALLRRLDVGNNDIASLPPELGFVPLHALVTDGNLVRGVPRDGGTKAVLKWLRDRMRAWTALRSFPGADASRCV